MGLVNIPSMLQRIPARVGEFEEAGYPFDAVMVVRAADDEFPDSAMVDLAEIWNASYEPKIRLATVSDFFEHLLTNYGDVFPTYRGDASGMWESVAMVTPATTARVRRARALLPDVEELWRTLADSGAGDYPSALFGEAWKLAMIFDEHSNGGMGWPGLLTKEEIESENREFVTVALRCQQIAEELRGRALALAGPRVAESDGPELVLFNPRGEAFDGVVELTSDTPLPADLRLIDPAGGPDAELRWLDDERRTLAVRTTVPLEGWTRWRLEGSGAPPPPPVWIETDRIGAGPYELVLDPILGTAVSLNDRERGIDWLDQPGPHRFGGIEQGNNTEVFFDIWREKNPGPVTLRAEDGAIQIFRRIQVVDPFGRVLREYRLFADEPRVDLIVTLRRSALPFVEFEEHSHHYAVSFPMNLALPTTLWVDGPDGWFRPGPDSLPGSAVGHLAASTGARLEGSNGRWVSITSIDSPMLDLGEMSEGPWQVIETDEYGMAWKLRRHADLGQVKGGALVPIEAEPGMPDATDYRFVVRFGEANDPPPSRETLRRDLSPPLATWVEPSR